MREYRFTGNYGGVIEIASTNEGLNAVVEREARADEGGGGVGEARGVGVTRGARGGGVSPEGV